MLIPLGIKALFHSEMEFSRFAIFGHLQLNRLPDLSEASVGEQYLIR